MLRVLASLPSCIIETSMGLGLNGAVELPNRNVRKSSRRVHVSVQVSSLKKTVLRNKPLLISPLHWPSKSSPRIQTTGAVISPLCTELSTHGLHKHRTLYTPNESCSLLRPLIRHVVSSSTNHAAPLPSGVISASTRTGIPPGESPWAMPHVA